MTATAKTASVAPQGPLVKTAPGLPAFVALDRTRLGFADGVSFGDLALSPDTEIPLPVLTPGWDYVVAILADDGITVMAADGPALPEGAGFTVLGGFHYAPGGNATDRAGGDDVPAINPHSIWDLNYRPVCPDPRGMACVVLAGGAKVWVDIYLLNQDPFAKGSSRFGVGIADGYKDLPIGRDGARVSKLDWRTARDIYHGLGKDLLSPEEFFAAAYGVTEGTSVGTDPATTRLDAPRSSRWGLMQATGNMSTWGNDGDTPARLAAIFGGNWGSGVWAGSRQANVGYWDGDSGDWISARGRSDHLQPV